MSTNFGGHSRDRQLFETMAPELTRPGIASARRPADGDLVTILASLRAERERQGLSMRAVAAMTRSSHGTIPRLDPSTISKMERGIIPSPGWDSVRAYAMALGKRLAWSLADP